MKTTVVLQRPLCSALYHLDSATEIAINFSINDALFKRFGSSLTITLDGRTITLQNFFTAPSVDDLPSFTLENNHQITARALLASLQIDSTPEDPSTGWTLPPEKLKKAIPSFFPIPEDTPHTQEQEAPQGPLSLAYTLYPGQEHNFFTLGTVQKNSPCTPFVKNRQKLDVGDREVKVGNSDIGANAAKDTGKAPDTVTNKNMYIESFYTEDSMGYIIDTSASLQKNKNSNLVILRFNDIFKNTSIDDSIGSTEETKGLFVLTGMSDSILIEGGKVSEAGLVSYNGKDYRIYHWEGQNRQSMDESLLILLSGDTT